jgi:hypothetical protein
MDLSALTVISPRRALHGLSLNSNLLTSSILQAFVWQHAFIMTAY